MSGSGQEALLVVREWSGDPSKCPDGLSGYPGVVERPSRLSGSGREALPNVREWSGGPPECQGRVGRRSQMSVSGSKALPEVWEWWGVPLGCPGGLADIRKWSEDPPGYPRVIRRPPGCPGEVGRPSGMSEGLSRKFGSGRRPSWMSRSGWEFFPNVQECLGGPPG